MRESRKTFWMSWKSPGKSRASRVPFMPKSVCNFLLGLSKPNLYPAKACGTSHRHLLSYICVFLHTLFVCLCLLPWWWINVNI